MRQNRRAGMLFPLLMMIDQLRRSGVLDNRRRLPVVTLGLIGLCWTLYYGHWEAQRFVLQFAPLSLHTQDVCVHAPSILNYGEYSRLLLAALFHADDMHLYYNSVSLLWKGAQLEGAMGSGPFLALCVGMTALSHAATVLLSLVGSNIGYPSFYHQCAIGISALIFALKTILNQDPNMPQDSNFYGFRIPTRYAAWAELVLISLLVPNASFVGHLGGIVAGLAYVYGLLPAIRRWQQGVPAFQAAPRPRMPAAQAPQQEPPRAAGAYDAEMAQLYAMGFHDRAASFRALRAAGGDVTRAVEELARQPRR